jgi:hypothetical protein
MIYRRKEEDGRKMGRKRTVGKTDKGNLDWLTVMEISRKEKDGGARCKEREWRL